jgi:hypothetical protein
MSDPNRLVTLVFAALSFPELFELPNWANHPMSGDFPSTPSKERKIAWLTLFLFSLSAIYIERLCGTALVIT